MCAGAFLGATMSRYVVAPVFVLTAAVITVSMLVFRFGPAGAKHPVAETN
jgi:hypothetical protein